MPLRFLLTLLATLMLGTLAHAQGQQTFQQFLDELWPDAKAKATFCKQ